MLILQWGTPFSDECIHKTWKTSLHFFIWIWLKLRGSKISGESKNHFRGFIFFMRQKIIIFYIWENWFQKKIHFNNNNIQPSAGVRNARNQHSSPNRSFLVLVTGFHPSLPDKVFMLATIKDDINSISANELRLAVDKRYFKHFIIKVHIFEPLLNTHLFNLIHLIFQLLLHQRKIIQHQAPLSCSSGMCSYRSITMFLQHQVSNWKGWSGRAGDGGTGQLCLLHLVPHWQVS